MSAGETRFDPESHPGFAIMAAMFGEERVRARAEAEAAHPDGRRMNEVLRDFAYGRVWNNDILTPRERSLITVALLAGLGRDNELKAHIKGALRNGCTLSELHEVMVHLTLYCGFPAGLGGQRMLQSMPTEEL